MHHSSRRDFFKQLLGAGFAAAGVLEQAVFRAARARAQAVHETRTLFDIHQAAQGVYIALSRPAVMLNCNAVIFENSKDLMVVDAHSKPSAVAALVAQLQREVSSKSVRYVVNTHFHYDHADGTPAYRTLAPQARVLASSETRALISEHSAQRAKASVESMKERVEAARRSLAGAKTPAERAYFQRVVTEGQAFISEMAAYAPELPDITFGERLVIHDKAHELHLVFRGRAHTASDISVFCPQKKVVATGDLLTGFIPGMGDGYPMEWPRTLSQLAELEFTQVLPGHGDVQPGRQRLFQLHSYIEEVNEAVARGRRAGIAVEELQQQITPAKLRSLNNTDFGEYVTAMAAKYRLLAPGSSAAESVASGVRSNVADVYRSLAG